MQLDVRTDIDKILEHQHPNGAFVASPEYSQYPFCWLRDGAFIAYALDRAGEHEASRRFHAWQAGAVLRAEQHTRELMTIRARGEYLDHGVMPPARFTLEGAWEEGDWPNFQIDGYGQWLWSVEQHSRVSGDLPSVIREGADLVAEYLAAFWDEPCYDAWEEGRTQHHTSTIASACAGLNAAVRLFGQDYLSAAEACRAFLEERCVSNGHFVKSVRNEVVDASLLWLATPFDLVADDDPVFVRTLRSIESDLLVDGGLMRYRADTFYGGGAWVLLTAWLAWHHVRCGRHERAKELLAWVERQRSPNGDLPEQVPTSRSDPWFLRYWSDRWGTPACPLLWSHAIALLARLELETKDAVADSG